MYLKVNKLIINNSLFEHSISNRGAGLYINTFGDSNL